MICGWAEYVSASSLVLYILGSLLYKRTSKATGCSTSPCRPVCLGMDSHIRNSVGFRVMTLRLLRLVTITFGWNQQASVSKSLSVTVGWNPLAPVGTRDCNTLWLDWKPFVSLAPDECSSVTVILRVRIQLCSWEKTGFAAYHVFHSALVSRQIKMAFLLLLPPIMKEKVAVTQDAILTG